MYALVEIKGKQYKAEKGAVLTVDKVDSQNGDAVEFDRVLLVADGEKTTVGAPYVAGVKVKAVVEDAFRDKKVKVLKFKRRKGYLRQKGHRQQYTKLKVEDIIGA
ncbi:MAG: 50S ribosomal protein L21 [Spirochaetales bacterium]|nr:50S ribosomal protein L21 [Spirochaetales bacterium]